MPGPLIHMSNARHTAQQLKDQAYHPPHAKTLDPEWTGTNMAKLGKIMQDHPNFTAIGAVGPDMFYMLPDFKDIGSVQVSSLLVGVVNFLEELYEAMDPYVSKWEHYLGPISEDTAEEMSRLTGGLSEVVGDISGELLSILVAALEGFAVKEMDFLGLFSLNLDRGYDDQAYTWVDMLHYRRTADFGRALWQRALAQEDEQLQAYALGYLTHVAADTTGHPFINVIVGGPYRTHWGRHHVVENHSDALWYLEDPAADAPNKVPGYRQMTESALYFDIAFDEENDNNPVPRRNFPGGNTLRDNWTRKRLLDIDSALPDSLAKLLLDTIDEIFYAKDALHPLILRPDGRPDETMLKNMYDLFFRLEKLMTVDGFNHEPPEPPDVFPNLDFPTFSDPAGDEAPDSSDGGSFWDDLLDFLLSIIAILAYIVEVAVYLATLPWAIVADVVTYPLRLGLYYALELPLFHLLKNFRAVMVMMGYFLPMEDEITFSLTHAGLTAQKNFDQVLAEMGDVFGGMVDILNKPDESHSFRDGDYPHALSKTEFRHPWNYPNAIPKTELPRTTASPYGHGAGPSTLFANLDPDPGILTLLEMAPDPETVDANAVHVTPKINLGSAVSFSKYQLWLATRDPQQENGATVRMTNWNLDSDRGYGYHCWDFNRNAAAEPLKDPEGNPFQPPCVWPPEANSGFNPALDQKVHWVGPDMSDPGCDDHEPPQEPPR